MQHWVDWGTDAIVCVAIVAWLCMARYFITFSLELRRARKAGGIAKLPRAQLIPFTKNIVPGAEDQRRKLVWSMAVFFGSLVAGVVWSNAFAQVHP